MSNDTKEDFDFEWEERDETVPFNVHFLAGSIAGISEHTIILPIDNMKTHIQKTGASTKQVFKTLRKFGYSHFYQGAGIISIGCIPSHALYFSTYEITKKYFIQENTINILGNALVGGFSVIAHDLIMTPCELVKQRMQLLKASSSLEVIREFRSKFGIRGFWRSFPVNLVQNLPYSMATVSANETFKETYRKYFGAHTASSYFLCGSLAGCVSSLITSPLDNIKTYLNSEKVEHSSLNKLKEMSKQNTRLIPRVQRTFASKIFNKIECVCSATEKNISKNLFKQNKMPKAFCAAKQIYKEAGYRGFFRGLGLRMFMQSSSTAVSWTIYEMCKKSLMSYSIK